MDGNAEIIKKYEKYLAYWVSESENGQAIAINKGFKMAKGSILPWLRLVIIIIFITKL